MLVLLCTHASASIISILSPDLAMKLQLSFPLIVLLSVIGCNAREHAESVMAEFQTLICEEAIALCEGGKGKDFKNLVLAFTKLSLKVAKKIDNPKIGREIRRVVENIHKLSSKTICEEVLDDCME